MRAELLLREFKRIAEAPDAIGRLRRVVLDLAVRGKVTDRKPTDEPASQLLLEIERKMIESSQVDVRRKPSRTLPVDPVEAPFPVPKGWLWTRIRQVTRDRGQTTPSSEFTYIDVTSIDKEAGRIGEPVVLAARDAPSRARKIVKFGDVLFSCVRPYLSNIAIVDIAFEPPPIASTAFAVLDGLGLVAPRYLWTVLRSPYFVRCVEEKMRGQAYPAINDSDFALLPVPLPPLAEQQRIVAKVDELMALCGQLEAAQKAREGRRNGLRTESLRRLTASFGDGAPSVADVRFFLDRSPRLITKPEHVAVVRQTIVDLAVRGRLVPQNSADEPAAEVLLRIPVPARKRRLRSSGYAGEPVAIPFAVPMGWEWTDFGRLISSSDAGWSPKTESFARDGDAWAVLKVSAVSWDAFRPEENKQLLPGVTPRFDAQVRRGDFLVSRANTSELVAKAVVVLEPPRNLMLSDKIVRLELVADCVPRYLLLINNHAEYARAYYAQEASGASPSMKNVSREVIYGLAIPLAPIAEQHRIVAKVDELMAVGDALEAALTSAQTERRRLLEALLDGALETVGL